MIQLKRLSQDVSQTFGLDKTESEIPDNLTDIAQSVSEQGHVECGVQNDHKMSVGGVESDNNVQLNKETPNLSAQYSTEIPAVSNLCKSIHTLIIV